MQTNRRTWIKRISLGMAGISLGRLDAIAKAPDAIHNPFDGANETIRLSSNENPYGSSPAARTAMTAHIAVSNRYNWELNAQLISRLAVKNKVADGNILLGAGSTELIDLVVRHAALGDGNFIIADPSYNYWTETATTLGLKKISVPLTPGKKTDLDAMLRAIGPDTRLVYICNPNNPTGTICDHETLLSFVQQAAKKTLVLADEAYLDFTKEPSLAPHVLKYKNLVIVKTFSKIYGLAGARIGYAIANSETLEKMALLQSWNNGSVSVMSAAAAIASLKDESFVRGTYEKNEAARKFTIEQLQQMKIPVIPAAANFLYFSLSAYKGDYFQRLNDHSVAGTRIYEENGRWTRITVGTMAEMKAFIKALR